MLTIGSSVQRPRARSALRLQLGSAYYTLRRSLWWLCGGVKFARRDSNLLEYDCFSHQTPLLRKLKDVDMYLQYNKIVNLKIAVAKLNYVTICPGETFSFWKLVGRPSKSKGYLDGMILQNGEFKAGTGGGLCQLSNLIYWIASHTPLTITERHRHSYDVFPDSGRTQPFGSGATCFYNYGDLMIENSTRQFFQFIFEVTESELRGICKTSVPLDHKYEVYEKEHIIRSEYWGGYTRHNTIYRKKYDLDNTLIADEFLVENHAVMMYSPLLPSRTASV